MEKSLRIVTAVIVVGINLALLDEATGGEVRASAEALWGRILHWWDHRSILRMALDAADGARATIEEGERWSQS